MKKYILLLITCFICFWSTAQDVIDYKGEKINALDDQGRQTGIWKVYDDANSIVIVSEFKEGIIIAGPKYYKDSALLADTKEEGRIEIYKGRKIIEAHFYNEPLKMPSLVDNKGKEFDKEKFNYLIDLVRPIFYQGSEGLNDFVNKAIDQKLIRKQKGKVKVGFVIDRVGKTSEIKILESTNPALNEEAKRIISILPRWQPAHQHGKFVRFSFNVPINFN